MIGAAELVLAAVQRHQLAAAMQASIVVGADLACRGARDDEGFSDDLVDMIVARVGDILFAAGHLPDLRPDV